jgi:3-oxoacyl-[acyl-carrier protein] reductase
MELKGRTAVITGGANGIGEAVAKSLAKSGMKISIGDISQENIDRVVKDIRDAGGEAIGALCDVTKEDQVAALMDKTVSELGEINVVFPSAGIIKDALMVSPDRETGKVTKKMSLADFQRVVDINLTGTFLTIREAVERMINGGFKGVVFTVSSVNKVGVAGQINYSSTKAATAVMPHILCNEFFKRNIQGIRAVGIAPGYVATPILTGMNPKALEAVLKTVPIGRLIEPDEIAALVKHCVENEALHGITIDINGGIRPGN